LGAWHTLGPNCFCNGIELAIAAFCATSYRWRQLRPHNKEPWQGGLGATDKDGLEDWAKYRLAWLILGTLT